MAFRKRNVPVGGSVPTTPDQSTHTHRTDVRPSSLTSHPVTSTGASSLDALLGGHGGLALGSSLLIGESGTTDFAGALLRYYAAEGICHGHTVHVVGMGDGWVRELPGVTAARSDDGKRKVKVDEEKMKIAWRYENLGQAGERAIPGRTPSASSAIPQEQTPFCHTFDLTKRLVIPQDAQINHINISPSLFEPIIQNISRSLQSSAPTSIHRTVIPVILSPAFYPPEACRPEHFLRFFHSLRSLLRQYPTRLTAMITLSLELYPRTSGLVRWAESLSDGVLELTPFPHLSEIPTEPGTGINDEQPQGMVNVHKAPIDTERGEGGAGATNKMGEDLAFTVSRRKFVIKPFSLPPMEGDQEAQKEGGALSAKNIEF